MSKPKHNFLIKLNTYFKELPFDITNKKICVCLSGGADSVSLLLGLNAISVDYNISLIACHFNHMLRGAESDRDEVFCKRLCQNIGIELYCGRDDVSAYCKANGKSLEEGARECRYAFFDRVIKKRSVDFCATAHNMNDDAETLILNLIRGSGSNGASAIAPYDMNILRPLLNVKREEIEAYLNENNQDYVTDSTNVSVQYTRNFIRHELLPKMEQINPSVVEALSRYINSSREDRLYFDSVVRDNIHSDLRILYAAVRKRIIIYKCLKMIGVQLNSDLIKQIDEALFSESRRLISINDKFEAIIENGNVMFAEAAKTAKDEFEPIKLELGENIIFNNDVLLDICENIDKNKIFNKLSTTEKLSFDNIVGSLSVRNRRTGDKIKVNNINKSVKKLFIDKRIPKEYRNIIPIIIDDEGIIYIPFVAVADRVKVNKDSKAITINTVFNSVDKERWLSAYEK